MKSSLKKFVSKSYREVTLIEISVESCVCPSLIKYYFKSKINLYNIVVMKLVSDYFFCDDRYEKIISLSVDDDKLFLFLISLVKNVIENNKPKNLYANNFHLIYKVIAEDFLLLNLIFNLYFVNFVLGDKGSDCSLYNEILSGCFLVNGD